MAKSMLAVLASASVFAPGQGSAEVAFENVVSEDGQDQALLIKAQASNAVAMRISPTEDLSKRSDVVVSDTEYELNLTVPTPLGHDSYEPWGGFQGGAAGLNDTILHIFMVDQPVAGVWLPGQSCFTRQGASNINWTPTRSQMVMSFHVDRAKFDAARKQSSQTIVLEGWTKGGSSCPAQKAPAPAPAPSTSDDEDK